MSHSPATSRQAAAAAPTTPTVDADCVDVEFLILDGCHVRDAFLRHPCEPHAEEVLHLHAALLAAAAEADGERCDDALAVAGDLERTLSEADVMTGQRGAA